MFGGDRIAKCYIHLWRQDQESVVEELITHSSKVEVEAEVEQTQNGTLVPQKSPQSNCSTEL